MQFEIENKYLLVFVILLIYIICVLYNKGLDQKHDIKPPVEDKPEKEKKQITPDNVKEGIKFL
jgi:hypothetical protein